MSLTISRVEMPDGSVVSVEHPEGMSESKVMAFARINASSAKSTESLETSTDNTEDSREITTSDLVKLGLSRFAVQFVPDVFLTSSAERQRAMQAAVAGEAAPNGAQVEEQQARQMAGFPQDAQLDLGQEIVAGLADPLTLAGTPVKQGVTGALRALVPAAGSTVAGTTAGVVAPQVAAELGAGQLGQELAGAIAGGTVGAATGAGVTPLASTGFKVAGDAKRAVFGESANPLGAASEAMAASEIRSQINSIQKATAPGEVAKGVNEIVRLKEEIPDLELGGIIGTLAENPVARNWVRKTAAENKGFQKQVSDTLKRDAERLADRLDVVAGIDPERPITRDQIEEITNKQFEATETRLRDELERKTANIDSVMAGLSTRLTGTKDAVDVGRTANKLLKRKEAIVRAEADKLYDVVSRLGRNVRLSQKQVFDVYNQFKNVRLSDVFGPQSAVAKQLETTWKPKEIEDADGNLVLEMPEVKGTDLISLKKAINSEITKLSKRNLRDDLKAAQTLDKLYQTKEIIRNTVNEKAATAPRFVSKLRDADAFYYKELGLPLRAEGMRDFTAKRFDQGAADSLMNFQQAEDYVNFVGKQGEAVVRHAIRLKAEKAGVIGADGRVNPNALQTFVRKNQRLIQRFGLAEEFNATVSELKTIKHTEARHNEAFREKARENSQGFFKAIADKNLSTVVSEMKNSPSKRKTFLAEINKLDKTEKATVMAGLREEFLGQALTFKGSMEEYIKTHTEAASDIFGPQYVGNIQKLAAIRDKLKAVDGVLLDSIGGAAVMDTLQESVGVGIPELAGTFRNQILSTQRKFMNLAAKSAVTKGREKFYTKSAEVLVDPDVVQKLANPPQDALEKAWKGSKEYAVEVGQHYVEALKGSVSISTLRALEAATDVSVEEER